MSDPAQSFVDAFIAAWMARDGTALANLFVPDADFVNVVGIWWEDRAAIAKAHQYALDSFFSQSTVSAGRVKTRALGPDHLLVHVRARLTGQIAPDGTTAAPRTTILSFVLERHGADWLAVSAQNTDIVIGAETQLAGAHGVRPQDYRDPQKGR